MKIINAIPDFLRLLERWTAPPSRLELQRYTEAFAGQFGPLLEDFQQYRGRGFEDAFEDLDWAAYRQTALAMDASELERRLRVQMDSVEKISGRRLEGIAFLFGSFGLMDGYARFHHGLHTVYLGVDVDHQNGNYLEVLMSHELTHVVRESTSEVWTAIGANPQMHHDFFGTSTNALEHLLSEGISCAVSELLNPGRPEYHYVYQTQASLEDVNRLNSVITARVREVVDDTSPAAYRALYDTSSYSEAVPFFAHYVWARRFALKVLREVYAGEIKSWIVGPSGGSSPSAIKIQQLLRSFDGHSESFLRR